MMRTAALALVLATGARADEPRACPRTLVYSKDTAAAEFNCGGSGEKIETWSWSGAVPKGMSAELPKDCLNAKVCEVAIAGIGKLGNSTVTAVCGKGGE